MTPLTHPSTSIDLVRFVLAHIDADEAELKRMSRRRRAAAAVAAESVGVCSVGPIRGRSGTAAAGGGEDHAGRTCRAERAT